MNEKIAEYLKFEFPTRDEMEDASKLLTAFAESNPVNMMGPDRIVLFTESDPVDGRSLYTTNTGAKIIRHLRFVAPGKPMAARHLPKDLSLVLGDQAIDSLT